MHRFWSLRVHSSSLLVSRASGLALFICFVFWASLSAQGFTGLILPLNLLGVFVGSGLAVKKKERWLTLGKNCWSAGFFDLPQVVCAAWAAAAFAFWYLEFVFEATAVAAYAGALNVFLLLEGVYGAAAATVGFITLIGIYYFSGASVAHSIVCSFWSAAAQEGSITLEGIFWFVDSVCWPSVSGCSFPFFSGIVLFGILEICWRVLSSRDYVSALHGHVLGLRFVPVCDAEMALYTRFVYCLFLVQGNVCAVKDVVDSAFAFPGLCEFTVDALLAVASIVVCYQCLVAVSSDNFGLVTTTLCHEGRGSRTAFAQAKATPRVDVAETPDVEMELEKPECRFPVFVRTFFGTRTFYVSSSMLISDFILLVSQSTAVPETSFYLTFQGSLLHGGHVIGEVGIGRDASLTMRGRLLGGANKGASFPQYHEWYCVRCQRGGCWATKFSCFRCGLSRLESEASMGGFPQPTSKGGGKGKGVFREAQYPGRGGDGVPRNVPPTTRRVPNAGKTPVGPPVQLDQLIGLLTGLGCSAAVLKGVEEAVNAVSAKSKPRVVPAAEHTVFVLKDKWDRAEAHRKFLQEHAERKQQEYEAASQRATDQAVLADDLKRQYWKARKELDKTAASCASASVGERESVNSDDGLANVGLDDEEMEQVYPDCMLDTPEAPPAKRAKGRANDQSSNQPVGETAPVPPTVTQIQNLHLCQDEQQIMRAVQSWSPEALDTVVRLCQEHRSHEEALKGSLG